MRIVPLLTSVVLCTGLVCPSLLLAQSGTAKNSAPASRLIRVGLSTAGGPIAMMSSATLVVVDPLQPQRRLTVRPGDTVTFALGANRQIVARGQRWIGPIQVRTSSGTFGAWQSIRVQPNNAAPTHISTNGTSPRYQRAYRGAFELAPRGYTFEAATHRSPLRLVNILPLDEYLKGVVPWEMDASAPLEALKAQAICARSETLAKLAGGRHTTDGYDICDYDHCQGYAGTENEAASSSQAVTQTAGLAILHSGRIADAVYGTNSGGITAASGDVWRGTPEAYLQSVFDFSPALHPAMAKVVKYPMREGDWVKYCTQNLPSFAQPNQVDRRALASRRQSSPRTAKLYGPDDLPDFYRWTRTISLQQAATAMAGRAPAGYAPLASVSELRVMERAPSGHIKRLAVIGRTATGQPTSLTFSGDSQIRAMFSGRLGSTTALPSSTFVVLPQRASNNALTGFIIKGAGWGHGAGMCQRGARAHAQQGWDALRIIHFYFRGVDVRRVY